MRIFSSYDTGIVVPSLVLILISLVLLSSLDMQLFQSQLVFAILGAVVFVFASSIHIRSLSRLQLFFYGGSIIFLLLVVFFGDDVRGSKRWLEFAGFRMQSSELIKPFLILSFASILTGWKDKITLSRVGMSIGLFLPILILLLRQPDLGSTLVYLSTFGFMILSAGMSMWYVVIAGASLALSFPIIWRVLAQYQRDRIITFINPQHDPLGVGYNAIQSTIAVGSGLLFGRGLGRGIQSQLQFLPERHTDFIFATLSEEFGFIGSIVVLVLYFLLLLRILQIARRSQDAFLSLTSIGIFGVLLSQTFVNIGMNVGIVPITGVTLPLVSYGGSSLFSTMLLLGFANSISRDVGEKERILEIR